MLATSPRVSTARIVEAWIHLARDFLRIPCRVYSVPAPIMCRYRCANAASDRRRRVTGQ
jgi:hypothetical protein